MSDFNWDDESNSMDGYDTDPTPSPEVQRAAERMRQTTKPSPLASALDAKRARAAQAVKELDKPKSQEVPVDEEQNEYSEAEWRLEKAQFYRAVLNNQLLGSEHPAAIAVEEELQGWALGQLNKLLGLEKAEGPQATQAASDFTQEEVEALKLLAGKVLGRANVPPAVTPVTAPPKPVVTPVQKKTEPVVKPIQMADDTRPRGRGRPRKYPCKECGQLSCEHKTTKPAQQGPGPSEVAADSDGKTFNGRPIGTLPDGTRYIDAPNGVRYRLDKRLVQYRDGKVQEEIIPVELSRKQKAPEAKPYPSEQEAQMMAAAEAQENLNRVGSSPIARVAGATITGQGMIQAALAAPPKEEYFPQPPANKRR